MSEEASHLKATEARTRDRIGEIQIESVEPHKVPRGDFQAIMSSHAFDDEAEYTVPDDVFADYLDMMYTANPKLEDVYNAWKAANDEKRTARADLKAAETALAAARTEAESAGGGEHSESPAIVGATAKLQAKKTRYQAAKKAAKACKDAVREHDQAWISGLLRKYLAEEHDKAPFKAAAAAAKATPADADEAATAIEALDAANRAAAQAALEKTKATCALIRSTAGPDVAFGSLGYTTLTKKDGTPVTITWAQEHRSPVTVQGYTEDGIVELPNIKARHAPHALGGYAKGGHGIGKLLVDTEGRKWFLKRLQLPDGAGVDRAIEAESLLGRDAFAYAGDDKDGNDVHYVVTEYCGGQDLSVAMGRHGEPNATYSAMGDDARFDMYKALIHQMNYLHANGYTHNDLKPENVIFDEDAQTLNIVDLELVFPREAGACEGHCGTPEYLTKYNHENWNSKKCTLDFDSDQHSMALILAQAYPTYFERKKSANDAGHAGGRPRYVIDILDVDTSAMSDKARSHYERVMNLYLALNATENLPLLLAPHSEEYTVLLRGIIAAKAHAYLAHQCGDSPEPPPSPVLAGAMTLTWLKDAAEQKILCDALATLAQNTAADIPLVADLHALLLETEKHKFDTEALCKNLEDITTLTENIQHAARVLAMASSMPEHSDRPTVGDSAIGVAAGEVSPRADAEICGDSPADAARLSAIPGASDQLSSALSDADTSPRNRSAAASSQPEPLIPPAIMSPPERTPPPKSADDAGPVRLVAPHAAHAGMRSGGSGASDEIAVTQSKHPVARFATAVARLARAVKGGRSSEVVAIGDSSDVGNATAGDKAPGAGGKPAWVEHDDNPDAAFKGRTLKRTKQRPHHPVSSDPHP